MAKFKAQGPTVKLSTDEVCEALAGTIDDLKKACRDFDDGHENAARAIAVAIRVLVHDTNMSTSLIKAVEIASQGAVVRKSYLSYVNTCAKIDGRIPEPCWAFVKLQFLVRNPVKLRYLAPLGESETVKKANDSFDNWWDRQIILIDGQGQRFTRKKIVLSIANQDGGAHVAIDVSKDYYDLTRNNTLGNSISISRDGEAISASSEKSNIAFAVVRQIAHELLLTLQAAVPKQYGAQYDPPTVDDRTKFWDQSE